MTLEQSLEQAVALRNAGRLAEAERLCLCLLGAAPGFFEARHLLGVMQLRQGRHAEALASLNLAWEAAPNAAPILGSRGLALQAIGRMEEALASYDLALRTNPNAGTIWYNRGIALRSLKRPEEALLSYDRALALEPNNAEALNNRGNILRDLGRITEALTCYDKALAIKPDVIDIRNNRGVTLLALDCPEEALASFNAALVRDPRHVESLHQRGHALLKLERPEDALASYDEAIGIKPGRADLLVSRATALQSLTRFEEAVASCDRALAIRPNHDETLNNRGTALLRLNHYEEALSNFDRALAINPNSVVALNKRGTAFNHLKRFGDALTSLGMALAIDPGFVDALNNQGATLCEMNRNEEALASLDRAHAIAPHNTEVLHNRGHTLISMGRLEDAAASFEAALEIQPHHRFAFGGLAGAALSLCDWERTTRLSKEIVGHIAENRTIVRPLTLLGYSSDPALLFRCAKANIEATVATSPPPLWEPTGFTGVPFRHDKIRIAYLSADFRQHPVANQLVELIERHDRSRFDVLGISMGESENCEIRARLEAAFGGFQKVSTLSDREAATLIRNLEVDIVIDLNGFTLGGRPDLLKYRPAPVQVSYLGYPGTLGANFIDYIIADKVALPFDQQPYFTEQIVHLPDSFFPTDSRRPITTGTLSRQDAGLPEEGFVFCCFSNNWKITAPVFDVWMRLLKATPGSVLWLKVDNRNARDNLCKEAVVRGVDSARLIFSRKTERVAEHLARHRLADLFLDTVPYNAHATACDALWAGLPVLTCLGESFAARVAASLLQAVSLPDLVTSSLQDYEAAALQLVNDPARLRMLRLRLEENRLTTPLFDGDRLRQNIEAAYTRMWAIAQAGEKPCSFAVSHSAEDVS